MRTPLREQVDRAKTLARRNGMWWWNRRLRIADWCFALFTLPFSGLAMLAGVGGGLGVLSALFGVYGRFMDSLPSMWWTLLGGVLAFVVPGVLASLTMLWRRSAPRWLLLTGLLMLALYGNPIPLMVGLYSYPAHFNDRKVLTGWFALGCLAVASVFNSAVISFVMTATFILVLPTIAGLWIGTRRELVERLRERAERLEREQHMMAE
ncbi:sensor histidine kinase, partial [Nocardiopsis sp. NPDC006832]